MIFLDRVTHVVDRAETALIAASAVVMFAIMAIVVADVGMRYLFNAPLEWSYDLIARYLIVYLFYFALSDTLRRDRHIVVDILARVAPPWIRCALELIGYSLALVVFAIIAWLGVERAWTEFAGNDVVFDSLQWPSWVVSVALPIGIAVMLLRVALRILALAMRLAGARHDWAAMYGEADAADPERAV